MKDGWAISNIVYLYSTSITIFKQIHYLKSNFPIRITNLLILEQLYKKRLYAKEERKPKIVIVV